MLDPKELMRAVALQRRSYKLLRWVADGVERGFISFSAAHHYGTAREAAVEWIDGHYENLPADTRPAREDLPAFATLFTTYLENTFDLVADPGQRLYSPQAHCFCPLCCWLADAPRLRPKKLRKLHKRQARTMKRSAVGRLAAELDLDLEDATIDVIVDEPELREEVALLAYGTDLLLRMKGYASGPATLALWRAFAWVPEGSSKKGFHLCADDILRAERAIADRLLSMVPRFHTALNSDAP